MPVVTMAVTILFTLLAFLCLDLFGLFGLVVWGVIWGLVYWGMMALKRHVLGPEEPY